MPAWKASLLLMAGAALLTACDSLPFGGDDDAPAYAYQAPPETGDGWPTSDLSDVGMDPAPLVRLMTDLHGMSAQQMHSLLVIRQGRLVFEEYFPGPKFKLAGYTGEYGFDRDDTDNLASVTKSFTSTLVGIAIDRGYIPSVQERVFDYFPEHTDLVAEDARRGEMTIEDLLRMESGLVWHDMETYPYTDPRNDLVQMFTSSDPIRHALSRPLHAAPGTVWEYCNANTNILGEIVRRAAGVGLDAFSGQYLFDPLGIETYEWQELPNDVTFASGDLQLRPRDMAKLGQLFLSMGTWSGEQIVSRRWVETAAARHVAIPGVTSSGSAYGYGWWHWDLVSGGETYRTYQAAGWGGQWIVVIPERDMVVVATGGYYFEPEPLHIQRMLTQYILPAVR